MIVFGWVEIIVSVLGLEAMNYTRCYLLLMIIVIASLTSINHEILRESKGFLNDGIKPQIENRFQILIKTSAIELEKWIRY